MARTSSSLSGSKIKILARDKSGPMISK